MVEIQDTPQTWWEIDCTYDGTPGSWALAAGDTAQEAEANFRRSLLYPYLAVDVRIKRVGTCTAFEVLARAMGGSNAQNPGNLAE
jgi:hypothetical protein